MSFLKEANTLELILLVIVLFVPGVLQSIAMGALAMISVYVVFKVALKIKGLFYKEPVITIE
jgi:hypothetical protein